MRLSQPYSTSTPAKQKANTNISNISFSPYYTTPDPSSDGSSRTSNVAAMAEVVAALGVVASVAQLADFGFRLSVKLLTFSNAVASADTSVKDISNDVSLTSTVLKELYRILQEDESHVVSDNAIEATSRTVKECLSVFEQLSDALDKSFANLGVLENKGKAKRAKVALEKLKWPFKQNKMELLRSNLDRLRSSLTLMLQVLSYARDVSNRKAADYSFVYQKHLIESLARSEKETKHRYLTLQKAIEGKKAESVVNAFINTSVHVADARDMGIMSQPTESENPATPVVHHRTIVGELLLCFQLLNDVLGYHLAISNLSKLSSMGYDQLRVTLERIHVKELIQLKEEFSDAPTHIKAEAAQNLETRLKELARAGSLKERKQAPLEYASKADDEQNLKELRQKHEAEIKRMQDDMHNGIAKKDEEITEEINRIREQSEKGTSQRDEIEGKLIQQRREHAELKFEFIALKMKMEQELSRKESRQAFENERRAAALQAEIDSTTEVMRNNINKVSQRGERLDSLHDKTESLSLSSAAFYRGAKRVQKDDSLWAKALRGVTQGVGIVGEVGNEGFKAVKVASGSVYEAATSLLPTIEDDEVRPTPDRSRIESQFKQQGSQIEKSEFLFGSDLGEDDLEAAEALEAMRLAEEQDEISKDATTTMNIGLDEALPPYSLAEGSDDDYKHMDLGIVGGGYAAHMSYGGEFGDKDKEARGDDESYTDQKPFPSHHEPVTVPGESDEHDESEDEDIVDELLSQWTNLPETMYSR